jgi:competence protein ComEA
VASVDGSLRDRLADLSRRELVALVLVGAVVVAGAALWYVRSLPQAVRVREALPAPGPTAASPSPATLIVHVAGEVRRPGVYEFQAGDRVVDAIDAARGPKKDANLDGLNLAAPLTDGEQVLVPGGMGSAAGGGAVPPSGSTGTTGGPININTASEGELEELPGIGPVLAQRILDYRTDHGPFPTVDALDDVTGIGPATMDELRDLITV